jgi:hypothetical protein
MLESKSMTRTIDGRLAPMIGRHPSPRLTPVSVATAVAGAILPTASAGPDEFLLSVTRPLELLMLVRIVASQ